MIARDCIFEGSSTFEAVDLALDTAGDEVVFEDCTIRYNDTVADTNSYLVNCDFEKALFSRCKFDLAFDTASTRGFVDATSMAGSVKFVDCSFEDTNTGVANAPFRFTKSATTVPSSVTFDSCYFDVEWDAAAASTLARTLLHLETSIALVTNCDFRPIGNNTIGNTSAGNEGHIIYVDSCRANISHNKFGAVNGTNPLDIPHFVSQVTVDAASYPVTVSNNTFNSFYKGVNCLNQEQLTITGNTFAVDTNVLGHGRLLEGVAEAVKAAELRIDRRGEDT